ncbi:MAG TPA: lysophospholipid acyltransferase family protein [Iamia sp.]|nr:lysophospholipid acyltransferase family protein [Iamia sp.]
MASKRTGPKRLEVALRTAQQVQRRLPRPSAALKAAEFPLRAPTLPGGVEPRPKEQKLGAAYDTDWARSPAARLGRLALLEGAVRPLIKAVADPERRGYDRLVGLDGPAIFAANHLSHLDAGLLLTSLPEPWRHRAFAGGAADYFFDTRLKATLSALALNAIPIERTKVTRRSTALATELIEDGWSMVIFPEGGRSPDGWAQSFRAGAAFLAVRCQVPVVPVHLEGTGRILPKGTSKLVPGKTRVTFGTPIHPGPDTDMRVFSTEIEAAVTALADEVSGDWFTARQRAHAGQSPPLSGPDASAWRRAWALGDRRSHRGRRIEPWPLRD